MRVDVKERERISACERERDPFSIEVFYIPRSEREREG